MTDFNINGKRWADLTEKQRSVVHEAIWRLAAEFFLEPYLAMRAFNRLSRKRKVGYWDVWAARFLLGAAARTVASRALSAQSSRDKLREVFE